MPWKIMFDVVRKRDDGAVVEPTDKGWRAVVRDGSDVRCTLRTAQGHTRTWKSAEAAIKAVDREHPETLPAPEPKPVPVLSAKERQFVARVGMSNGGSFFDVADTAGPLVERGVLRGGPVKNHPHYWQLWLPLA